MLTQASTQLRCSASACDVSAADDSSSVSERTANNGGSHVPAKVLFALSPGYDAEDVKRSSNWRIAVFEEIGLLPERLEQVVTLKYYGRDGRPWTLKQIGLHFGVSDERVRQWLQNAYRRLRQRCQDLN